MASRPEECFFCGAGGAGWKQLEGDFLQGVGRLRRRAVAVPHLPWNLQRCGGGPDDGPLCGAGRGGLWHPEGQAREGRRASGQAGAAFLPIDNVRAPAWHI